MKKRRRSAASHRHGPPSGRPVARPAYLVRLTVPFISAEWPGKEQKKL
jgi:hypothetical protein